MTVASAASIGLGLFGAPAVAYDAITQNSRGRAVETVQPEYQIEASIQPVSPSILKLLGEGFTADGTVVIWTRATLHYPTTASPGGTPDSTRQTFVRAFGAVWRVVQEHNWAAHADYRQYVAQRYVESAQ